MAATGEPSLSACPECHGVLRQVKEAGRLRFRCHTGHAYSTESLMAEITDAIEVSLWNAIRSLQEGALLLQHVGSHVDATHPGSDRNRMTTLGQALLRHADALRAMVTSTTAAEGNREVERSQVEKPSEDDRDLRPAAGST